MIQLLLRLFRKSIGLFVLLTLFPLLGLLLAINVLLNLSADASRAATWAAIAAWASGVIAALIVRRIIRRQIGRFGAVLGTSENLRAGLKQIADSDGEYREIAAFLENQLKKGAAGRPGSASTSDQMGTVIESIPDGVVAIDFDERILFANTRARRILGIAAQRLSGRPMYEIIRHSSIQDIIRAVIRTGETDTVEIQIPRSELRVTILAAPLVGDPCPGIVLVLHDVSAERKQENVRRDFIAAVSHELKTPLTVIQACTETLLNGALDEKEDAIHFLRQITEQSERMHELVVGMLRLSRVETGQTVFHPVELDLGDLARRICDEFELPASQERISLTCQVHEPLIVHADPEAMRTIISNLIDNALKYCDPGETVTVECSRDEDNACLKVIDTGPGIPVEHRDRVFERFYRVDRHRSREKGGTGLGLAIVKHMVQLSGGTITLRSRIGQGSTFIVSLPIAVSSVATAGTADSRRDA